MAMTSRVKHSYDAEPAVLFRALGSAQLTVTGGSSVLDLHKLSAAYWQGDEEIADKRFDVVIMVEQVSITTGISLAVQVDDAADMASAVTVQTITDPAVGEYVVAVDADTAAKLIAGASHIRVNATLGVSDTLTYAAWIVPHASA